ncbi:MAG: hypothetical protein EBQ96_02130 [Proteobacteria bacterium]|nr:hypothetical protein [Pseudomonadota bacterium]
MVGPMQKNDTYEFRTYTATIIESRNWSETHFSGGGGGSVPFGGVHVSDISSHSVSRQVVWLRDDKDGTEFESELSTTKLACRVGHKLLFVHGNSLRKSNAKYEKLLAIRNLNTGQTYMNIEGHTSIISDAVPFSFATLIVWILLCYASILVVLEDYQGLLLALAFAVPIVSSYCRHRKPRKLLDRLLDEILQESTNSQAGLETLTISGLARG